MVELLIVFALVLLNGFFALSEMAVMTARKTKLKQLAQKSRRAAKALELSEHPESFLSAVQVWITLLGLLTGYFGGESIAKKIMPYIAQYDVLARYADNIAFALSFTLILFISVVLGELVPKRLGSLQPEKIAPLVAMPMSFLATVARPVVFILASSTRGLLKLIGFGNVSEEKVTEEEIRHLVAESHEQGVIDQDERNMLNRVLRLGDRGADSLMTPRNRIVWLDTAARLEENLATMRETPLSRYPVFRESDKEVVGILEVKSLAGRSVIDSNEALFADLQDALYVSDSTQSLKLLDIFREEQQSLALVVDEYGEIEGLVTLTDLLNAVLGRVQINETDSEEPMIFKRHDESWLVDGRVANEELRELLGVHHLPGEDEQDFHTIAGMVVAHFGRIPHVGESFTWQRWRIEVVDLDGARIDKVLIEPHADNTPPNNNESP
jgi:putative hemolysin